MKTTHFSAQLLSFMIPILKYRQLAGFKIQSFRSTIINTNGFQTMNHGRRQQLQDFHQSQDVSTRSHVCSCLVTMRRCGNYKSIMKKTTRCCILIRIYNVCVTRVDPNQEFLICFEFDQVIKVVVDLSFANCFDRLHNFWLIIVKRSL